MQVYIQYIYLNSWQAASGVSSVHGYSWRVRLAGMRGRESWGGGGVRLWGIPRYIDFYTGTIRGACECVCVRLLYSTVKFRVIF